MRSEVCEQCGGVIPAGVQAYVRDGRVLCGGCQWVPPEEEKGKKPRICTHCGYVGCPQYKGLDFVEILLWLLLLPLGIIYTIWRVTTKDNICPGCGKRGSMILITTPVGQKLFTSTTKPSGASKD